MDREKSEFESIPVESENAIEEMHLISRCMKEHFLQINPSVLFDLEKYHKKAWDVFLEFKNSFIQGQVRDNLERGKKEGHYREEIDVELLSAFRIEQVQMIFNTKIFHQISLISQIFK